MPQKEASTEIPPIEPYAKYRESDRKMLIRIGKKFALLIMTILLFDTIIDMMSSLIDIITEVLHIGIEVIEYSLEVIIEHLLHADHHQSETIIVNIALISAFYLSYKFSSSLYQAFIRQIHYCHTIWKNHQCREIATWQALTLSRKIKVILAYAVGIMCVLFLITL